MSLVETRDCKTGAEALAQARRVQKLRDADRPAPVSPWATRVALLESELRDVRVDRDVFRARCERLENDNQSLVERLAKLELEPGSLDGLRGTPISIQKIARIVCFKFRVSMNDLTSHRRAKDIMDARHIAVYLCKMMTGKTLPQLGAFFGDRDHTTMIHAIRRIDGLMKKDKTIKRQVHNLVAEIRK